jgi:hypothetical protein
LENRSIVTPIALSNILFLYTLLKGRFLHNELMLILKVLANFRVGGAITKELLNKVFIRLEVYSS